MRRQFVIAIVVIWLVLDVVFRVLGKYAPEFQVSALEVSNVILAALSLVSYALVNKRIGNNAHAFVRGVYGATFLKLMVCMVAMLAFVLMNKSNLHKPTVFVMFGVYVVYSVAETIILSKLAKTKKENSTGNA